MSDSSALSVVAASPRWKIPLSVLVVIHTADLQVLLLRRTGGTGESGEGARTEFWQSVTGSKDRLGEDWRETAARETPASSATSFALTAFLDIIPPAIAFCTALQR